MLSQEGCGAHDAMAAGFDRGVLEARRQLQLGAYEAGVPFEAAGRKYWVLGRSWGEGVEAFVCVPDGAGWSWADMARM